MASIVSAGTTSGTSLNLSADTSGVLQLATNGTTTAVTIDTSQNVGIGTASPGAKVEISGTAAAQNLALRITNTATDGYSTLQLGGSGDGGVFRNGSAQSGYAGASSLNLITVGAHAIGLATGNTIRAVIPAAGGVQAVTCVSVGNTTPASTGAGITFPASQSASSDANTLDDYEEGTWTPIITGATTAGTGTYTLQLGRYTKVGRLVTLEVYILWTAHTGTGNMQISNLPFTNAANNNSAVCFGYVSNIALTAGNIMTGYTGAASTNIVLYQYPTGGGATTAVPIDTAGDFVFSVTYSV